MKNLLPAAVALLLWGVTITASAQVYRCKTAAGGTEFSQIPCGKDSKLIQDRASSIDTGPPTDPFGVQRERDRLQLQANPKMSPSDIANKSAGGLSPPRAARQIDTVACERADRDAHIESRHARQDKAAIKRKQDLADWECGRTLPASESNAAAPSTTKFVPGPVRNPSPTMAGCDSAGCWDTNGGRYNRAAGNTFFGPNGVACTGTAGGMVCP